jgi:hypothetical protein
LIQKEQDWHVFDHAGSCDQLLKSGSKVITFPLNHHVGMVEQLVQSSDRTGLVYLTWNNMPFHPACHARLRGSEGCLKTSEEVAAEEIAKHLWQSAC